MDAKQMSLSSDLDIGQRSDYNCGQAFKQAT